jgi:hypothetical protein
MATIQNVVMIKQAQWPKAFSKSKKLFKPDFNKDENTSNGQCLGKAHIQ